MDLRILYTMTAEFVI